jgi:hypothetical protein
LWGSLIITPASSENQPSIERPLEIRLPDERFGTLSLIFKAPSRENILASANRLLKAQWPLRRVSGVYERLLKTNALSPGISRKVLEGLPIPTLEAIYRLLWQGFRTTESHSSSTPIRPVAAQQAQEISNTKKTANQSGFHGDALLSLFLLAEEMHEFIPLVLVRDDIRFLGQREAPAMHGYYYDGELTRPHMIRFLRGQGYRSDFLEACDDPAEAALHRDYLACRRLGAPLEQPLGLPEQFLPWSNLLTSLSAEEMVRFPRLGRLQAVLHLLKVEHLEAGSTHVFTQPLTPKHFVSQWEAMQRFLQSESLMKIASDHRQPRPLRVVVLVEGETEKRLLPLFAQAMGHDFDALGIDLLPAGGKNHVIRLYREYADYLAVPLCVLLDNDASEIAAELRGVLRPGDRVFCFSEGEFEDTYSPVRMLETINRVYQPFPELTKHELNQATLASGNRGRVPALRTLWQTYGFGTFDKVAFADQYAESLQQIAPGSPAAIPPEPIREILAMLLAVRDQASA